MRFLKVQVLLLLIALVLVGALVADVVLKSQAETELAAEVARRVPGTTGVEADISSFPFVGRLIMSGKVPKVVITAQHVGSDPVELSDIRVQVDEVEMDTAEARGGKAVVRSIKRGSVRADLRADQVNPRLPRNFQVEFQSGKAVVKGPGSVQAELVATPEGSLQLRAAGKSLFELAFPKTDLLPCAPTATFVTGAVRLACSFEGVPPLLLNLAQR